jgi:two-component system response regulator
MEKTEVEILLIEDNLSDAEMTIRALRKGNIANKILHLEDGFEAIEFLFGTENIPTPKVILLDLKMPRINGIEVLQKIKSDERTKNIPVVILTSSNENPDIKICYTLGVNAYVVKPVEVEKFNKAVHDLGLFWILTNQTSY